MVDDLANALFLALHVISTIHSSLSPLEILQRIASTLSAYHPKTPSCEFAMIEKATKSMQKTKKLRLRPTL